MTSTPRPLASLQQNSTSNRSSTSLITPQLSALADPTPATVDQHVFEYLIQEVIRLIISSETVARERRQAHERQVEQDLKLARNTTRSLSIKQQQQQQQQQQQSTTTTTAAAAAGPTVPSKASTTAIQDEADEGVRTRLDKMGFKVGWALVERLARDRPRFPTTPAPTSSTTPVGAASLSLAPIPDPLETVKFVCKDVWIALYDKQIDNLRTNHRGVYVLHDNGLKPLMRLSGNVGQAQEVNRRVKFFLAFPSGIIRGALANLGVPCTVSAESAGIPQCTFQIKTVRPGA